MYRGLRIAIISHAIDTFEGSAYMMNRMAGEWKRKGARLAVIKGAEALLPDADLAILHTDITTVGEDYARIIDHYPTVINSKVRTTAKSSFSELIVNREDRYRGPVVVKTDNNYRGMREMIERLETGDFSPAIEVQRPWRKVQSLEKYPVFNTPAEVPPGVWKNPSLVVEKFLPERSAEGQYVLRLWVFLGDREIYYQCVSNEPIVKSANTLRREALDPSDIPQAVRRMRERLNFDYGKFDFGIHNGEPVVYDVNRTPTLPTEGADPDVVIGNMEMLSEGLDSFIAG